MAAQADGLGRAAGMILGMAGIVMMVTAVIMTVTMADGADREEMAPDDPGLTRGSPMTTTNPGQVGLLLIITLDSISSSPNY